MRGVTRGSIWETGGQSRKVSRNIASSRGGELMADGAGKADSEFPACWSRMDSPTSGPGSAAPGVDGPQAV